jgi:hypothetical protein
MGLDTLVEFTGRTAGTAGLTTGQEDISEGVEAEVGNVDSVTIFLDVAGAVNVTVEFSPDGGTNWYQPAGESPIEFTEASTDVVHVDYNVDRIRLSGSDATAVKAQLREVV